MGSRSLIKLWVPFSQGLPAGVLTPQPCLWTRSLLLKSPFPLCSRNVKNLTQSSWALRWVSFYALLIFLPASPFSHLPWVLATLDSAKASQRELEKPLRKLCTSYKKVSFPRETSLLQGAECGDWITGWVWAPTHLLVQAPCIEQTTRDLASPTFPFVKGAIIVMWPHSSYSVSFF